MPKTTVLEQNYADDGYSCSKWSQHAFRRADSDRGAAVRADRRVIAALNRTERRYSLNADLVSIGPRGLADNLR